MEYEYILTPDGELYHWGIKGMKWGQRRYQNKDGSLTPAGKKRYAKEEAALKEREKSIKNREREAAKRAKMDAKKADLDAREAALNGGGKKGSSPKPDALKQKSVKDMTDDELRTAIARKQLENMYAQYHPQPKPPESFGKRFVNDAVKPAAINAGKDFIEKSLKKVAGDILKDKVDPNSLAGLEATNKKLRAQIENKLLKEGIDPNIKGENLEKILNFNEKLSGKKQTKADAQKAEKDSKKQSKSDAKSAKEQAKADKKAEQDRARSEYEEAFKKAKDKVDAEWEPAPEVTVEGVGNSRRKNSETRSKPDPIIIDMEMEMGVTDLPAVYTEYGRDYVDLAVYGRDRRGGG